MQYDDIHPTSSVVDRVRYSAEQKAEVFSMLEAILDRLDKLQRPPDPWEETSLILALNFLDSGLFARARRQLDYCLLPQGERPGWREEQAKRNPRGYSVARLRTRLENAMAGNR